jgi:hypothetical protein
LPPVTQPPGKVGPGRLSHHPRICYVESRFVTSHAVAVLCDQPGSQPPQRGPGPLPIGHYSHRQTDHDPGLIRSFPQKPEHGIVKQRPQLRPIAEPQKVHAFYGPGVAGHVLADQVGPRPAGVKAHLVRLAGAPPPQIAHRKQAQVSLPHADYRGHDGHP